MLTWVCPVLNILGLAAAEVSMSASDSENQTNTVVLQTCLLWSLPKIFFLTLCHSWWVQGWEATSMSLSCRDCGMGSKRLDLVTFQVATQSGTKLSFPLPVFCPVVRKSRKKPVHRKRKGWTHRRLGQRRGRKPQQCSQASFHFSFLRPGCIPAPGSFATWGLTNLYFHAVVKLSCVCAKAGRQRGKWEHLSLLRGWDRGWMLAFNFYK